VSQSSATNSLTITTSILIKGSVIARVVWQGKLLPLSSVKGHPTYCGDTWLQFLHTFKDNFFVVRFLVEQACLSTISRTSFHHGGIDWESFPATIFEGDPIYVIPPWDHKIFFIPKNTFFKDINALYLKVDVEKKTVLVVSIQITIAKTHKDLKAAFYSQWSNWLECFGGYQVKTTVVWVVENEQSWVVKKEEIKTDITRA
jgi:hypothetical protein